MMSDAHSMSEGPRVTEAQARHRSTLEAACQAAERQWAERDAADEAFLAKTDEECAKAVRQKLDDLNRHIELLRRKGLDVEVEMRGEPRGRLCMEVSRVIRMV